MGSVTMSSTHGSTSHSVDGQLIVFHFSVVYWRDDQASIILVNKVKRQM